MQLQALEVAIGLIAAFFTLSVLASVFVEICSTWFRKRSKDLMVVLDAMLSTGSANAVDLKDTSIYKAMQVASRRKRGPGTDDRSPSYISARSFADGVIEGIVKLKQTHTTVAGVITNLPAGPLKERITTLQVEFDGDLAAMKAGLEGWFDDTMDRLEGAYKRWTQWLLLLVGLLLAFGLNVSAVRIADTLWNDATLRTAVADSAVDLTDRPCPDNRTTCTPEEKIDKAVSDIDGLNLPIGWTDDWSKQSGVVMTLLGMLFTGATVMLGAPFWFDLLTRLAGARSNAGGVPPKAAFDAGSATFGLAGRGATVGARKITDL